jgi:hypothetical protein
MLQRKVIPFLHQELNTGLPTERAFLTASFNNSYLIGAILAGGVTFPMKDFVNGVMQDPRNSGNIISCMPAIYP